MQCNSGRLAYHAPMSETDKTPFQAFMQALLIGWVLGFALVGASARSPVAETGISDSF